MNSTTWTDASGRQWSARIAIADVARIRDCGIDVMDAQGLPKVFEDPLRVVELIVLVHRGQWELLTVDAVVPREPTAADPRTTETVRRPMTADDFAEIAVANEQVAGAAVVAVQTALADFLRRLGRAALAELVEASMRAQQKAERAALEKVRDPRVEQVIERETSKALAKIDAELEKACS